MPLRANHSQSRAPGAYTCTQGSEKPPPGVNAFAMTQQIVQTGLRFPAPLRRQEPARSASRTAWLSAFQIGRASQWNYFCQGPPKASRYNLPACSAGDLQDGGFPIMDVFASRPFRGGDKNEDWGTRRS